jgi:hypothetical protein
MRAMLLPASFACAFAFAACMPVDRQTEPKPRAAPGGCAAAFELAAREEMRAGDREEPPTLLLEGRGACEGTGDRAASELQARGVDAWPWSADFGDDRPRCPSAKCGPAGGATRVTVEVVTLPAKCEALTNAREDDADAQGKIDMSAGRGQKLTTACASEKWSCERARVRVLRHGGGHGGTFFLLCEDGHYVAYADHGGAVVY